jgi:5'(3')-deoxyribonucleotidase
MDGTLAEFRVVDTLEILYEKDYFLNLKPQQTVIDAVKNIVKNHPEVEVYVLSAVLSDSKYALEEKNAWLDKYLSEIPVYNRIFTPCGADKKEYIAGGIRASDFLLDDYSVNLNLWEPPAKGIKIMNGINGTKGTWSSEKLSIEKNGNELAGNIIDIMCGNAHFRDTGPLKWKTEYPKISDGKELQTESSPQNEQYHHNRKGR